MRNPMWLPLSLLLLSATVFADDEQVESDDEGKVEEVFVPGKFTVPDLGTVKPHFFDYFPSKDAIGKKWIKSTAKKDDVDSVIAKYNGEWEINTPSEVFIEKDFGLIVTTKARHHAIAARLSTPFTFDKKPLVVQYEVKFEEGQECGGGYLKLLSSGAETDLAGFTDKTPYTIMFGPDKCSTSGKVHLIFRYKNPKNGSVDEYHAKQPSSIDSAFWDDHKTHLYTLVLNPDGAYVVSVDHKNIFYGNMLSDLVPSLEPPKEIADPDDKKPADWDDRAEIDDETAVKPDDWDESQPKTVVDESAQKPSDWNEEDPELIPDPEASKPSDWDVEMDGDWEPPLIDNPACKGLSGCGTWKRPTIANPLYKGKWIRPKISNPNYKGAWAPRQIVNPSYFEPTAFGGLQPISTIGIELWTMSKNIIFDNILIADDEKTAQEVAKQTFEIRRAEEARLAASKGQGEGLVQTMLDAANERPWLWAIYVLCVLIPVILLGVCCFGRKSSAPALPKRKYDSFREDEKAPNLIDEEGEEVVEEETGVEKVDSRRNSQSSKNKTASKAMQDIEDDDGESAEENEEVEEAEPVVEKPSPKPSPAVTKRRARRQD